MRLSRSIIEKAEDDCFKSKSKTAFLEVWGGDDIASHVIVTIISNDAEVRPESIRVVR